MDGHFQLQPPVILLYRSTVLPADLFHPFYKQLILQTKCVKGMEENLIGALL